MEIISFYDWRCMVTCDFCCYATFEYALESAIPFGTILMILMMEPYTILQRCAFNRN